MLTVNGAAELSGRSLPQTSEAVTRLAQAGVLSQVSAGKRNRAFEAKDLPLFRQSGVIDGTLSAVSRRGRLRSMPLAVLATVAAGMPASCRSVR